MTLARAVGARKPAASVSRRRDGSLRRAPAGDRMWHE